MISHCFGSLIVALGSRYQYLNHLFYVPKPLGVYYFFVMEVHEPFSEATNQVSPRQAQVNLYGSSPKELVEFNRVN